MNQDPVKSEERNYEPETEEWILVDEELEENELASSFVYLELENVKMPSSVIVAKIDSDSAQPDLSASANSNQSSEVEHLETSTENLVPPLETPSQTLVPPMDNLGKQMDNLGKQMDNLGKQTEQSTKSQRGLTKLASTKTNPSKTSLRETGAKLQQQTYAEVLQKANQTKPSWSGRGKTRVRRKKSRVQPNEVSKAEKKTQRRGSCAQQCESPIKNAQLTLCV